jgi:hypothetical protein
MVRLVEWHEPIEKIKKRNRKQEARFRIDAELGRIKTDSEKQDRAASQKGEIESK